ncbi:unnamed protein product [Didymodactylos carnosus]|uniref:MACPF domain-containing protein n=1 Tax=Didymodactylos carnosus TaxID=1234261 RepID=A0A813VFB1_9BILA|nr:unnamed protein product [Didymodactylos carnosus]CAF0835840.1 unnamed protein product [Didymodactylos carnosus]CAF3507341.1 unnamed protein product [Didymodactylos carnosus]CAF3623045.1 unnamed protein product [Didymodactylos carnosus]
MANQLSFLVLLIIVYYFGVIISEEVIDHEMKNFTAWADNILNNALNKTSSSTSVSDINNSTDSNRSDNLEDLLKLGEQILRMGTTTTEIPKVEVPIPDTLFEKHMKDFLSNVPLKSNEEIAHITTIYDHRNEPKSRQKRSLSQRIQSSPITIGGTQFKTGDVTIKVVPVATEDNVHDNYGSAADYPLGIGAFLQSSCFRKYSRRTMVEELQAISQSQSSDVQGNVITKRRRRSTNLNKMNIVDSYCRRYIKFDVSRKMCRVILPAALSLGVGFDTKKTNSEDSRRKSVITRWCSKGRKINVQGSAGPRSGGTSIGGASGYDLPDSNDTFATTTAFQQALSQNSEVETSQNSFSSTVVDAYAGVDFIASVNAGYDSSKQNEASQTQDQESVEHYREETARILTTFHLEVNLYQLILDNVDVWSLNPDFLADFLELPVSYFKPGGPYAYSRFIDRYGTHYVYKADFGGKWSVFRTQESTRIRSTTEFAQSATSDFYSMVSNGWRVSVSAGLFGIGVKHNSGGQKTNTNKGSEESGSRSKQMRDQSQEYASTTIVTVGGKIEVGSSLSDFNNPGLGDKLKSWVEWVPVFPRSMNFRLILLSDLLDINPHYLFPYNNEKICDDKKRRSSCKWGKTLTQFGDEWEKRRRSLQTAIQLYLQDPLGLYIDDTTIKSGNEYCIKDFKILYRQPSWDHLRQSMFTAHLYIPDVIKEDDCFNISGNVTVDVQQIEKVWTVRRSFETKRSFVNDMNEWNSRQYVIINYLVLQYLDGKLLFVSPEYLNHSHMQFCNKKEPWIKISHHYEIGQVEYRNLVDILSRSSLRRRYYVLQPCGLVWRNAWQFAVPGQFHVLLGFTVIFYSVFFLYLVKPVSAKDIECLTFVASTTDSLFVVFATTPRFQHTWYTFVITPHGVIFQKGAHIVAICNASESGTSGASLVFMSYIICFNYEINMRQKTGLHILYGVNSGLVQETQIFLSYTDYDYLAPNFFTFGSGESEVQLKNIEPRTLNANELSSFTCNLRPVCQTQFTVPNIGMPTALQTISKLENDYLNGYCNWLCAPECIGCTRQLSRFHCIYCRIATIFHMNGQKECLTQCPLGFIPDERSYCVDLDECATDWHHCQSEVYHRIQIKLQKEQRVLMLLVLITCTCLAIQDHLDSDTTFPRFINIMSYNNPLLMMTTSQSPNYYANQENAYYIGRRSTDPIQNETDTNSLLRLDNILSSLENDTLLTENGSDLLNKLKQTSEKYNMTISDLTKKLLINSKHRKRFLDDNSLYYNDGIGTQHYFDGHDVPSPLPISHHFEDHLPVSHRYDHYLTHHDEHYPISKHQHHVHHYYHSPSAFHVHDGIYLNQLPPIYHYIWLRPGIPRGLLCKLPPPACTNISCPFNSKCTILDGSVQCVCSQGYQFNIRECTDINECLLYLHSCHDYAICINTPGSYKCKCQQGFVGDGHSCYDVNECATTQALCSPISEICLNNYGSYRCICRSGFYSNGSHCQDLSECFFQLHHCDSKALCLNTIGSYECSCKSGYHGNGHVCTKINRWNDPPADWCKPSETSCTCPTGYLIDNMIPKCEDVNECLAANGSKTNICMKNSVCINTIGSYECRCLFGYERTSTNQCSDIDECYGLKMNKTMCHPKYGKCINTDGSYECGCIEGFIGSGHICLDVDECKTDLHKCPDDTDCINTIGSFICQCKAGYTSVVHHIHGLVTYKLTKMKIDSRLTDCVDINECHTINNCSARAYCANVPGSYYCLCKNGYEGDGYFCDDLDECERLKNPCDTTKGFVCLNTMASYRCVCPHGYIYSQHLKQCQDLDECLIYGSQLLCEHNSKCINMRGTYRCNCRSGYIEQENRCRDFDECLYNTHKCHRDGICINEPGSYLCRCKQGFHGNGTECVDLDECLTGMHDCDKENAICKYF